MTLKKDKKKVLGETFDDERIKSFLVFSPPEGVNGDFHVLEKAYRGMREENFASFIGFFLADGRDINAKGPDGRSFLQTIENHTPSAEYIDALKQAGAQ